VPDLAEGAVLRRGKTARQKSERIGEAEDNPHDDRTGRMTISTIVRLTEIVVKGIANEFSRQVLENTPEINLRNVSGLP
jgi:hypothetical protein